MEPLDGHDADVRRSSLSRGDVRRHALGVAMVVSVAVLWVLSSEVIQFIFDGAVSFSKPFFVTYFSNTLFLLYLLPYALSRRFRRRLRAELRAAGYERVPLAAAEAADDADAQINAAMLGGGGAGADVPAKPGDDDVVPVLQLARTAFVFCLIWFCANYVFNLGLRLTSVASSSTLNTLSGMFTLLLASYVGAETFSFGKTVAVALNVVGVFLITKDDWSSGRESAWGDVLCVCSAFGYACYTSFLKVALDDDSRVDMTLFFGLVGLFNAVVLLPLFPLLHVLRVEPFSWPDAHTLLLLTLNALLGTLLSDYLWARSVLLTTPVIATLSISMSIPLSVFADWLLRSAVFHPLFLVGAGAIFAGFVISNLEELPWRS